MIMKRSTHQDLRKRVVRKNKFKQAKATFKRLIKLRRLSKVLLKRSNNSLRKNNNKLKKLRKPLKRKKNNLLYRLIALLWWQTHQSSIFKISTISSTLEVSIWAHLLRSLTCYLTLVLRSFMPWAISVFKMIVLRKWKSMIPGRSPWKTTQEIDKSSIMGKDTFLGPSVMIDYVSMEKISAFKILIFWLEIKVKIWKRISFLES